MIKRLLILLIIALFSPSAFSQRAPANPPAPPVRSIAGFLGLNQGIVQLSQQLRAQDVGVFATMNVEPPPLQNGYERNGQPARFVNARTQNSINPQNSQFLPPGNSRAPATAGNGLPFVRVISDFIPVNPGGNQNQNGNTPNYPSTGSPGAVP